MEVVEYDPRVKVVTRLNSSYNDNGSPPPTVNEPQLIFPLHETDPEDRAPVVVILPAERAPAVVILPAVLFPAVVKLPAERAPGQEIADPMIFITNPEVLFPIPKLPAPESETPCPANQ